MLVSTSELAFCLHKLRREKYIHFPDGVIMGVGETIFETPKSGPWTLGSNVWGRID